MKFVAEGENIPVLINKRNNLVQEGLADTEFTKVNQKIDVGIWVTSKIETVQKTLSS